jgi:hypothetical protein
MSSIGTPELESSETKLCRNSRGVHSEASIPAAARHGPEGTPHIGRVELGAVSSGEHEIVVNPSLPHPNPLGQLGLSVFAERVDAERGQLQGSAGSLRLCLTTCPHGPP